jgi:tetratricopeptide (TPR) repeat protein
MGIEQKYQIENRLRIAYNYEASGNILHAIQVYNSIINDAPNFVEAYFSLSELYEKQENIEASKKLLTNYLYENPDNNVVRLYFAQLLLRNSQWENVIDLLNSQDINEEPMAAFFLGYSNFMLQDYETAEIYFLQFESLGKKTELLHEAYIYIAKTEIHLKNFRKALEYAKKCEVVYSNFWELHLVLSIIYYNLNMYNHAISSVSKALKLKPGEASMYEWAGKINLKTGEYLKAEEYFLKHIDMVENPTSEVYSKLGESCLKNNKTSDALQYYELALRLDPLNELAVEGRKNASFILKSKATND